MANTFNCPTCFDARKIRSLDELLWCTRCVPSPWTGQPTTPEEDLTQLQIQRAANKNTSRLGDQLKYYTTSNGQPMTVTFTTTTTPIAHETAIAEAVQEQEDIPDGHLDADTIDPSICPSCGTESMGVFEKVSVYENYMYSIEKDDNDNWTLFAEQDGGENGETLVPMSWDCSNCGYNREIDNIPIQFP